MSRGSPREEIFVLIENYLATQNEGENTSLCFLETISPVLLQWLSEKQSCLTCEKSLEISKFTEGINLLRSCGILIIDTTIHSQHENVKCFLEAVKKFTKLVLAMPNLDYDIPERYSILGVIADGAYGRVLSAYDRETKENVAIKRITGVFSNKPDFQKKILREIKVMRHLRGYDGIVDILGLIAPKSYDEFNDVYIVMQLMKADVKSLRSRRLTDENVMYITYHIAVGLFKMHSANIVHRDLICDFGLSRGIDDQDSTTSLYVVTRWYRSPEVVLQYPTCHKPMDIWSLGTIFGELQQREKWIPLFPGKSPIQQINIIIEQLGTPKDEDIKGSEKAIKYVKSLSELKLKKDWRKKLKFASDDAIDLLDQMLVFNPDKRATIEQVVRHKYFEKIYDPEDFIDNPPHFAHEWGYNQLESYKSMIHSEILDYNQVV